MTKTISEVLHVAVETFFASTSFRNKLYQRQNWTTTYYKENRTKKPLSSFFKGKPVSSPTLNEMILKHCEHLKLKPLQWQLNPINPANSGPHKKSRINGVAVLKLHVFFRLKNGWLKFCCQGPEESGHNNEVALLMGWT